MPRIAAIYDYRDRETNLLYQVVRFEPKDFRPRHVRDGQTVWGIPADVPRVPYRLPEMLSRPDSVTFLVEGEKDADRLRQHGWVATTLAGGAGSKWTPEIAEYFRDRTVFLVPDNDDAGRKWMHKAAAELKQVNARLFWAELPGLPPKGDVSDWLDMPGHSANGLLEALRAAATDYRPPSAGDQAIDRDLVRLETLTPSPVAWLWRPWIPLGKLSLIDGDPGQGKSYVTLDLAARLSRGDALPDGSVNPHGPLTTLLIACEDGLADTVLPRLLALGADTKFVCSYQGEMKDGYSVRLPQLPDDLDTLEQMIRRSRARLVVIDPMMAFLGASVNTVSDQSVRSVLAPLAGLAERTGAAIVFVRHLNKSGGKQAVYRGGGSIGIIAAMRTAMLIARHPHDRDQRVLAMVKCNLGPEPESLGFRLQASRLVPEGTEVAWSGPLDLRANDLVADVKEAVSPVDWLRDHLSGGPKRSAEIIEAAGADGISERTLTRAKAALGLVAKQRRRGGVNEWWWLPPGQKEFGLDPLEDTLPPIEPPRRGKRPGRAMAAFEPHQTGPYAEGY